ncbi:MAG: nitrate reductase [Neoaquamicrobium sediminum]|uniref:nitrate reductase n=1 Tax=Neoaquamicrobium sediminum TaxID=1849104 RepID=UPI0040374FC0
MKLLNNPLAPRRALPEKTRQIKAWVRDLYCLNDDVVVALSEIACRDEGCPDVETVIGIMRPGQKIESLRVHKALADVEHADLPVPTG